MNELQRELAKLAAYQTFAVVGVGCAALAWLWLLSWGGDLGLLP